MKTVSLHTGHIPAQHGQEVSCQPIYPVSSLVLMFFVFSGAGWIWEVGFHLVLDGQFFNRGFLAGPWLPIYGTGGVLILILLRKCRNRPLLFFVLTVLLCGTVEYMTGFLLETFFGVRWWNYSGMPFQIHGRVCLAGLLLFGCGGRVITYAAAPALDERIRRIPPRPRTFLCTALCLLFAADLVRSLLSPNMGLGITSL